MENTFGWLAFTLLFLCFKESYGQAVAPVICRGFIKSDFRADFSKVKVNLHSIDGTLKYSTSCAPDNGYFHLPLYDQGEYLVKIGLPLGWMITPNEIPLVVTDSCNSGEDIYFQLSGLTSEGQFERASVVHSYQDTQCAEGDTVCATGTETFGCCPTENAVCCGTICCPEGYTCDTQNEQCTTSYQTIRLNSSLSGSRSPADKLLPGDVHCADNISICPDNTRCCKLKGHPHLGCCKGAGAKAVCCSDEEHCCPENTTCDVANKNCKKKAASVSPYSSLRSILCPDGSTTCPDGNTCCEQTVKGTYGCCPRAGAACCTGSQFCCPHGYSCDPNSDKCKHSDTSVPTFAKVPLLSSVSLPHRRPVCPGGVTVCGPNDTCCLHPDNTSYGCCPTPNAVCCSDGYHCCPENYTCDLIDYTCKKNLETCATMRIQKRPVGFAINNNNNKPDVL